MRKFYSLRINFHYIFENDLLIFLLLLNIKLFSIQPKCYNPKHKFCFWLGFILNNISLILFTYISLSHKVNNAQSVRRWITCLTANADIIPVASQPIEQLVIFHHMIKFRVTTSDTSIGRVRDLRSNVW